MCFNGNEKEHEREAIRKLIFFINKFLIRFIIINFKEEENKNKLVYLYL